MEFSSIWDLFAYAKRDRYANITEDAKHYKIGEISTKTGLQKCLVNGNIVWLLPNQQSDFLQTRMQKSDAKVLASSAKLARADGYISFKGNIKNAAKNYLNHMKISWNKNPIKIKYLNNAFVVLNNFSIHHFFYSKNNKPRPITEIKERAECLPYVKDILERSGKPVDHTINNKGEESYTFIGKAKINNNIKKILVVISKEPKGFFYLSTFNLK